MDRTSDSNLNSISKSKSYSRNPLTKHDIIQLDQAIFQVFQMITEMRKSVKSAKYIKFPPLPSVFTESIVVAASSTLFGKEWAASFGGKRSDILLEDANAMKCKTVEVKATGQHAFQEIKAKDLKADILVWIRFGRRFNDGCGPIEIIKLEDPGKYISQPCRLDSKRFAKIEGIKENQKVFRFETIDKLLETR